MYKRSSIAIYLFILTALFSSRSTVPAAQAESLPTPTSTPTATPSPSPTPMALSSSGFNTSLDDSLFGGLGDDSMGGQNSGNHQNGSNNPLGSFGSALGQQIIAMVASSIAQQALTSSGLFDSGIGNQGLGSTSGFGSPSGFGGGSQGLGSGSGSSTTKVAYSEGGKAGPDGFQMPRRCANGPKDRSKFQEELEKNPALRTKLTKLCVKEVGGQGSSAQVALYESLFNRAQAEGNSISRATHNGYYEPMNKGTVDSVSTTSAEYKQCEASLQTALGGSNTIGCRRHNATTPADARSFGAAPNSIVQIGGETFYSKPGEKCDENFC